MNVGEEGILFLIPPTLFVLCSSFRQQQSPVKTKLSGTAVGLSFPSHSRHSPQLSRYQEPTTPSVSRGRSHRLQRRFSFFSFLLSGSRNPRQLVIDHIAVNSSSLSIRPLKRREGEEE